MSRLINLFKGGPKVGAPIAAPTQGNLRYPHAPITIQPPLLGVVFSGDPSQTIYRILEEIRQFPIGAQFFMALSAAGKDIGVRYNGPHDNSAAGTPRGYVKLRLKHDSQDNPGFAAELQATLNNLALATGNGIPWVAQQFRLMGQDW